MITFGKSTLYLRFEIERNAINLKIASKIIITMSKLFTM